MKASTFSGVMLAGLFSLGLCNAAGGASAAATGNTTAANASATAIFAAGCFWCTESDFDKVPGVLETISGYTGGSKKNPSYDEVSAGGTGHAEALKVVFDPQQTSYQKLLDVYWHNVDPVNADGQFCDNGNQYRSGIFYLNDEQKRLAEQSKTALEKSGRFKQPLVTEIVAATEFYPAEEYHQDFHSKNPIRYNFYRYSCGRDQRLKEIWGGTD